MIYLLNLKVLGKKFIKRKVHDYKMLLSLKTGGISKNLYLFGGREEDHREIMVNELKNGEKVLDIGSNIGYYALMEAMMVGKEGSVIAVEPDPRNIELLNTNIQLNKLKDRIPVHNVAISNNNGTKEFAVHKETNLNVVLPTKKPIDKKYLNILKVQAVDIYDFLQTVGKVDLIRMDIEGHEVEIFEGLVRLAKSKPQFMPEKVIFEVHTEAYDDAEHNMRKQLLELFNNGYRIKTLTSQDEEKSTIRELGYTPWKYASSDEHKRGLYNDISNEDAVKLICDMGGARIALLSRDSS